MKNIEEQFNIGDFDEPNLDHELEEIIKECVENADQEKAMILFKLGAKDIDRNITLKRNIDTKKKFQNYYTGYLGKIKQTIQKKSPPKLIDEDFYHRNSQNLFKDSDISDDNIRLYKFNLASFEELGKNIGDESRPENYETLFGQAEEILKTYNIDSSCIEKVIRNLRENKMIEYEEYKDFASPKQFNNFLSCIRSLPLFKEYRQYQGYNLPNIRKNFKQRLQKYLLSKADVFSNDAMITILDFLTQNPLGNFMSLTNITADQKELLYEYCWRERKIQSYVATISKPQSLKSKVNQIISKIMDFIIENSFAIAGFGRIIEALSAFDGEKFYDIQAVINNRKAIHEKLSEIDPYFFYYNSLHFNKCLEEMKLKFIMEIRKKLHELSVPHFLYEKIEEKLLSCEIMELWKLPLQKKIREEIIKFYQSYGELESYRRVSKKIISEEIEARREMEDILLKLNYPNLKYTDIKTIIDDYMVEKCLPEGMMSFNQQNALQKQLEASQKIPAFINSMKSEIEISKEECKFKLLYIFNSIPFSVDYETVNTIVQEIIKEPEYYVIMDSLLLNSKQKIYFEGQLKISKEFAKYRESFCAVQCNAIHKQFIQKLKNSFEMLDPQMLLLEYYELFAEVRFKNKKIDVDFYKQGILSQIYSNKSEEIRILQESEIYKKFKKNFVRIFNEKKFRIEKVVKNSLKIICEQNRMNASVVDNLARTNFDLTSFSPDIRDIIKVQPAYKKYQEFRVAEEKGQYLMREQKLLSKIQDLKSHSCLSNYSMIQRKDIINSICSQGLESLKKAINLKEEERDEIYRWIKLSDECRQFDELGPQKPQLLEPAQIGEQLKGILSKAPLLSGIRDLGAAEVFDIAKLNIFNEFNQLIDRLKVPKLKKTQAKEQMSSLIDQLEPLMQILAENYGMPPLINKEESNQKAPREPSYPSGSNKKIESVDESPQKRQNFYESPEKKQKKEDEVDKQSILDEYIDFLKTGNANVSREVAREIILINPYKGKPENDEFQKKSGIPKLTCMKLLKALDPSTMGRLVQAYQK